jgi:hypothetical protein
MNATINMEPLRRLISSICLFSLLLVSGCSSSQAGQPNAAPAPGTSSASPAQAPAPVVANPAPSAQATPVSPAAVAPAPSQEHLAGIGSATIITIHGKIVSVNRVKKLVTLQGPHGKTITLYVRNPYNLKSAKPGESFVARFYEIVTIRKQKPGESIPSVTLVEGIASAVPGETPGAAVGTSVQIVATIVAINRSKKTVDLKGPDGVIETVNVAHPSNLRHVKVGTDIVITLTKVMAISLDKETSA